MNKIVIVAGCLLGLALACIPAYASPTSKKVTITCNSATGASVTGTADVYLCSSIDTSATDPVNQCVGATQCPSDFTCDSTGTISITMPCAASSKVGECTSLSVARSETIRAVPPTLARLREGRASIFPLVAAMVMGSQ